MRKVFIPKKDGVAPVTYEPEKHLLLVQRFLYWGDGGDGQPLLLAGAIGDHWGLRFAAARRGAPAPEQAPQGAGDMGWVMSEEEGMIVRWSSHSFKVTTPDHLQPVITEAIGARTRRRPT